MDTLLFAGVSKTCVLGPGRLASECLSSTYSHTARPLPLHLSSIQFSWMILSQDSFGRLCTFISTSSQPPSTNAAQTTPSHNHCCTTGAAALYCRFMAGEASIAGERLEFALATMYDADEEFRQASNEAMPDLAELRMQGSEAVGKRLQEQLLAMMGASQQQQSQQQQQEQQQAAEEGGRGGDAGGAAKT